MAKAEDVSTDWRRSAGDFACVGGCERKRLPASEFSKKQVDKALESLKNGMPHEDIRSGPEIKRMLFLTGVCKRCVEEREAKDCAEAAARREDRQQAEPDAATGQALGAGERTSVVLTERPFGMTSSKADESAGYVVARSTEGKPAAKAGVRAGWRVLAVGGMTCEGLDLEAVQTLFKNGELPLEVTFEMVPSGADFCTACQQVLVVDRFSRKMRTKPADKRRCTSCVDAAGEGAGEGEAPAGSAPAGSDRPASKLSELQQLCAESAQEAQKVTGIRAARGAGYGGRGGGRGRR